MNLDLVKSLIDAMAASDLAEMEFSQDGWSLRLVRRPQRDKALPLAPSAAQTPVAKRPPDFTGMPPDPDPEVTSGGVVAPLFGIVHLQPAPNAPRFVSPGQAVKVGTPLCIIEAMKMFHEIRAERDGVVAAVLVSSGQEVEAGQHLMRFE